MNKLAHTFPYKSLRKEKWPSAITTLTAYFICCPISIWWFASIAKSMWTYIAPNVLPETASLNNTSSDPPQPNHYRVTQLLTFNARLMVSLQAWRGGCPEADIPEADPREREPAAGGAGRPRGGARVQGQGRKTEAWSIRGGHNVVTGEKNTVQVRWMRNSYF